MTNFILDAQLAKDCIVLRETRRGYVLLMNNAYYHWIILVPKLEAVEWYQVDEANQLGILADINVLSRWIKEELVADKLNVATIGNIVSQLHIHIVGRKYDDPAWPGVVWGGGDIRPYSTAELAEVHCSFKRNVIAHE